MSEITKREFEGNGVHLTLYRGDCLQILPTLGKVDCVLTDPPYNCGMKYATVDDYRTNADYKKWCQEWFAASESLLNERGKIIIFPGHGNLDMWFHIKHPQGVGCWYKPGSPRHGGLFQFCEWEPFLVYDPSCNPMGKSDVIKCSLFNQKDVGDHPCPKPLPLISELILRARPNIVLDIFMGSGTTAVACIRTGRNFIGCEIDEGYYEIACQRVERELAQGILNLK